MIKRLYTVIDDLLDLEHELRVRFNKDTSKNAVVCVASGSELYEITDIKFEHDGNRVVIYLGDPIE